MTAQDGALRRALIELAEKIGAMPTEPDAHDALCESEYLAPLGDTPCDCQHRKTLVRAALAAPPAPLADACETCRAFVDNQAFPLNVRAAVHRLCNEVQRLRAAPSEGVEPQGAEPHLFQRGDFTLHSGARSPFKIDCDALTDGDWEALAALAVTVLPPFSSLEGVPRGGKKFALALTKYITPGAPVHLIVDDVLTTGASMERARVEALNDMIEKRTHGVVAFARSAPPEWITSMFTLTFAAPPTAGDQEGGG